MRLADKAKYVREGAAKTYSGDEEVPTSAHKCHVPGCPRLIPPEFAMCPQHWGKVPKHLQVQIWRHYRPGQERDKRPSREYVEVLRLAIASVAWIKVSDQRLRALTVIQPFAFNISDEDKEIENRGYAPPPSLLMPGQDLVIHAGKKKNLPGYRADMPLGAMVAIVRFDGVTTESDGKWAIPGEVWWKFSNRRKLKAPISCGGALGLWLVPPDIETQIRTEYPLEST